MGLVKNILFYIFIFWITSCSIPVPNNKITSNFTVLIDSTNLVFPFKKLPKAAQIDLTYAGRTEMPKIVFLEKCVQGKRYTCFIISVITSKDTFRYTPTANNGCIYIDDKPTMIINDTSKVIGDIKIKTTPKNEIID